MEEKLFEFVEEMEELLKAFSEDYRPWRREIRALMNRAEKLAVSLRTEPKGAKSPTPEMLNSLMGEQVSVYTKSGCFIQGAVLSGVENGRIILKDRPGGPLLPHKCPIEHIAGIEHYSKVYQRCFGMDYDRDHHMGLR